MYGWGYKRNKHFFAAIQKYGWDGFYHIKVRTGLSKDEANELERRWIYLFRADNHIYGYNHTKGGEGMDLGKDSYSKEYISDYNQQYHNSFKYKHGMSATNYYLKTNPDYKKRHDEQQKRTAKLWYERFVAEHGMSPKAWRKHQLKNDQL